MIRAIMFDVFGTLLDMSSVPREELRAYGDHLRKFQETGVYEPLTLPESWRKIPVFPDVSKGLLRLSRQYDVCTFSNGPVGITGDAIWRGTGLQPRAIDVAEARGFKPVSWMYPWACGWVECAPSECMMVTANKDFGDLEGAAACGMRTQLIRHPGSVPDLIALAELLLEY